MQVWTIKWPLGGGANILIGKQFPCFWVQAHTHTHPLKNKVVDKSLNQREVSSILFLSSEKRAREEERQRNHETGKPEARREREMC